MVIGRDGCWLTSNVKWWFLTQDWYLFSVSQLLKQYSYFENFEKPYFLLLVVMSPYTLNFNPSIWNLEDIWFEIGRRIFFNATNTFCHCYKLLIYNLKSWNISSFNFFFIISILPIPKKKKLFDMKSDVKLNSKELKFVKIGIIQGSLFSVHNCDSLLESC